MTPSDLGEFGKQPRSVAFFKRKRHVASTVNTYGVKRAIRFLQILSNSRLAVPATIIAAIGDNDHGTSLIMRVLHMAHGQMNGVQQGSLAEWLRRTYRFMQLFDI